MFAKCCSVLLLGALAIAGQAFAQTAQEQEPNDNPATVETEDYFYGGNFDGSRRFQNDLVLSAGLAIGW